MKKILFLLLSIACLTLTSDSTFASFSVSLTPSNHNGYSVSCFGGRDGAINITVTGGTSPYTYLWSTGATTQNVSALPAGYYAVTVTDAASTTCSGNVTLTEPTVLALSVTPSIYNSVNNISCPNCCNGYINTSVTGGVTAYSYIWYSGQTTGNISNLCKNTYKLTVTDANGCSTATTQVMTEPDKDAWAQSGNSGSNPSTQFIGTTDAQDFSFRSNNVERLRIKSNGDLKINSFTGSGNKILYTNNDGVVAAQPITFLSIPCTDPYTFAWQENLSVNPHVVYTCWNKVGIGTDDPQDNLGINGGTRIFNYQNHNEYIAIGHNSNNPYIKTVGAYGLLINYDNGQDVKICTGNGGNVEIGGNTYLATGSGKQVGIGTQSPAGNAKLHVVGDAIFSQFETFTFCPKIRGTDGVSSAPLPDYTWAGDHETGIFHPAGGVIAFANLGDEKMRIRSDGKVGIGISNSSNWAGDYKLYVKNGIRTQKVKVDIGTGWADYVFDKNYKLKPLHEIENFIIENKHLEGIPTEKEIKENGLDLGEIAAVQMQKIEELTLYLIDLKKENTSLKKRIEKLEKAAK